MREHLYERRGTVKRFFCFWFGHDNIRHLPLSGPGVAFTCLRCRRGTERSTT